jgi:phosphosulfolactate synthase
LPASEFLGDTPRVGGLTHVIDKGMGPRAVEDFLETAGEYADIVKLGWGTAYVTNALERKLEIYRAFGMPVVIGGTFFEAVYAKGKLDEYKVWLHGLGLTHVELSDGTIEIPRERKLELIADFARDFTVLSEVGSKDPTVEFTTDEWGTWLADEVAAGAWKVIAEARETGSAGIFRDGQLDVGLITDLAHMLDVRAVIWEAPTKASQVFFLRDWYRDVNLGNIPPDEVIPLETLRRGLRGDTLKEILLDGERTAAS